MKVKVRTDEMDHLQSSSLVSRLCMAICMGDTDCPVGCHGTTTEKEGSGAFLPGYFSLSRSLLATSN